MSGSSSMFSKKFSSSYGYIVVVSLVFYLGCCRNVLVFFDVIYCVISVVLMVSMVVMIVIVVMFI